MERADDDTAYGKKYEDYSRSGRTPDAVRFSQWSPSCCTHLAAIGSVLAMTGQPDQALHYLDRAARVAQQNPETGYPFLIYTGRRTALKERGRFEEADKLTVEFVVRSRADARPLCRKRLLIDKASFRSSAPLHR